ncbi:hypothetical protein DC498_14565 [Terrimonas sp.]|uniref:hypothetical protein n=1 Tax=Terrimonas sp. TaxID=1914338 RepID=UPI000D51855B|nr:hypothetical protein [Terrimonas sp.]PVD51362.1 hypothetical protein DC498_14565 [Terrimonas sp.]
MKKRQPLCVMLCLLFASFIQAQDPESSYTFTQKFLTQPVSNYSFQETLSASYNEKKYIRFKRMRNTGIVLTSVGAGLLATGVVLISSGSKETDDYNGYYDELTPGDRKILGGIVCVIFGLGMEGGGIPLWAIGSRKMKQYGGSSLRLQPAKNGVALAYSF